MMQYLNSTDSLNHFKQWLSGQAYSSCFILVDENTERHCLPLFLSIFQSKSELKIIRIPAGEEHKTIQSCGLIWDRLLACGADRKSILINLGGGMVTDLGGFAASSFKRGIRFVHIPTTLLGMVDASIGGKTGLNYLHLKNQIGNFSLPEIVVVNSMFLESLPGKQLFSAFAEMLKYGLILDSKLWDELKNIKPSNLKYISHEQIQACITIKDKVVSSDFMEIADRKILNFGHTIGHALESFFMEKPGQQLLHGEAVAHGMILESLLSRQILDLPQLEFREIISVLSEKYSKLPIFANDLKSLVNLIQADKKKNSELNNFTLLSRIGQAKIDIQVTNNQIKESFLEYIEL